MAVPTPAEFVAAFEEYENAPEATIQNRIDMAARRTPAHIWGDLESDGVLWLAAYLLSLDPRAREMARAAGEDGENPYLRERKRLNKIVGAGFRVCGFPPGVSGT